MPIAAIRLDRSLRIRITSKNIKATLTMPQIEEVKRLTKPIRSKRKSSVKSRSKSKEIGQSLSTSRFPSVLEKRSSILLLNSKMLQFRS
jgi:hypothetical protein